MKNKLIVLLCIVVFITSMLTACDIMHTNNDNDMTIIKDATSETTEDAIQQIKDPTISTEVETVPEEQIPTNFQITLSFAGDCTLSNVTDEDTSLGFKAYTEKYEPSYFLEKVKPIFEEDDFTIVNLECVLSDNKLHKRDKGNGVAFWFKGSTSYAEILSCGSIEGVSLANNHTFDYGSAGYEETKQAVTNVGLQYGHEADVMYFEKNGFTIAVICHGLWYESEADNIIKLINTAEEQSDYQIVFYHGGTEALHKPEDWKIRASRKLVDNGADLVIGNHPHVLQPIETYNGAQIVYSLGNFCYGGHLQPRNRTMIYQISLTVNFDTLEIENSTQHIIPCYIYTAKYNNYQPTPIIIPEEIERVIKFLNWEIELPY